jgi:hypothetical protein
VGLFLCLIFLKGNKMNNQISEVYVAGDSMGNVITVSNNNPEYGWITLKQDFTEVSNGWINNKIRSTIIMSTVDTLEKLNLAEGEIMEGRIVIREQTEPFSTPDRDVKRAGAEGPVLVDANGNTIYRRTFFVSQSAINDNPAEGEDVLIPYANVEEVKAFNASQRNLTRVETKQEDLSETFDL